MKVLVTGAGGQLGCDVCRVLKERGVEYRGLSSKELDITDENAVKQRLSDDRPDAVIHCAAWTAVDKAETYEAQAVRVNAEGTRYIARMCRELGAKMVYISTDYVFPGSGDRPYEVGDSTGPLNVYGRSKLLGEEAVRELLKRCFIVRTSWVFGTNGNNFVKTMLRLSESRHEVGVVCDQIGSPTYTADLAPLLCDMIKTEKYGVYHATNEGFCSWAEFAQEIFRVANKTVTVHPLPSDQYPAAAVRPLNSRLSKNALYQASFSPLPTWQSALERFCRSTQMLNR